MKLNVLFEPLTSLVIQKEVLVVKIYPQVDPSHQFSRAIRRQQLSADSDRKVKP